MKKNIMGKCSICGEWKELTYEHVPPRKAFNEKAIRVYSFEDTILKQSGRFTERQKGAGGYTLCEDCNNKTGSWYSPAYIDMALQGMRYYKLGLTEDLSVPYNIYPLRVIKQVLSMIASSSGPGLFSHKPYLRQFILDKERRGLPKDMALLMYMPDKGGYKSVPIVGVMNVETGERFVGSEISFPPFSFVFNSSANFTNYKELQTMLDITVFSKYDYDDFRCLYLRIARKPSNPMPMDFREGIPDIQTIANTQRKDKRK